jgi:hypothetical protein
MRSLILDIQAQALDPTRKVTDLVRSVLAAALKLDLTDLRDWANHELRGYSHDSVVPPYRRVSGELRAHNPYRGWIPVVLEDPAMADQLSHRDIGQPLSELEDMRESDSDSSLLKVPLPHDILIRVFGQTDALRLGLVPTLIIPRSALAGILDAVRSVVLQWSISLEKAGVIGTDLQFSRDEIANAQTVPFRVDPR